MSFRYKIIKYVKVAASTLMVYLILNYKVMVIKKVIGIAIAHTCVSYGKYLL